VWSTDYGTEEEFDYTGLDTDPNVIANYIWEHSEKLLHINRVPWPDGIITEMSPNASVALTNGGVELYISQDEGHIKLRHNTLYRLGYPDRIVVDSDITPTRLICILGDIISDVENQFAIIEWLRNPRKAGLQWIGGRRTVKATSINEDFDHYSELLS